MHIDMFNFIYFAYIYGVKILNFNLNFDIFIAYNTDSIVEATQKKYRKCFKYDLIKLNHQNDKKVQPSNENQRSQEIEEIRKWTFLCISEYYKKTQGKYSLYFDILTDKYETPELYYHIEANRNQIQKSQMLIFVISNQEISFWQLQEAFFASYYDKKIAFLTTNKFLRLIKNKKFDTYIESQLKEK